MPDLVIVRLLLNVNTEDPAYVDVEFTDARQAKKGLNAIMTGQGQLVALQTAGDVPVLVRSDAVAAAFVVDYDDIEEDEEDEEDEE